VSPAARRSEPGGRGPAVVAAVAAGGAVGALARYGVGQAWQHPPTGFPWSTVVVNVSGCLAIGVLMAWLFVGERHPLLRPFVGVGILGGYTTFSSSMADSAALVAVGRPAMAVIAAAVTWALSLAAAFLGWRVATALAASRGDA